MKTYVGEELFLFQHATRWKHYFASKICAYIKGNTLEVGAGIGANARFLITRDVTSLTLLEPDPELSAKIPENTDGIGISKRVITGDIDALTAERFDTIIYIDVLEHIEQSRQEIIKIRSLLNSGGNLIILVPAFQFLFNEFDKKIGHFRRYTRKSLREEVNSHLNETALFYLDSCGFFAALANKILLRKSEPTMVQVQFWDKILVPVSGILDLLVFRKFGKSLVGVFQKQ
jgi:SAM-dependent methyltransferase